MNKKDALIVSLLILVLALFLSPLASRLPDGLEKIAREKRFLDKKNSLFDSPMPGYSAPGVKNEKLAVVLAGVCGTVAVFLLSYSIAVLLKKKRKL